MPFFRLDPSIKFEETIKVNARRLDTWAAEQAVDSIDFIWADVQGAQVDLIKGGRLTLGNTRYFDTVYSNRELYAGQMDLKTLVIHCLNSKSYTGMKLTLYLETRPWDREALRGARLVAVQRWASRDGRL